MSSGKDSSTHLGSFGFILLLGAKIFLSSVESEKRHEEKDKHNGKDCDINTANYFLIFHGKFLVSVSIFFGFEGHR